ncbi:MAG: PIG-L family deacetylase [Anaerolineales bacterium]|nr:PIG-L family deacetylase [Anaerolineales bacterium]
MTKQTILAVLAHPDDESFGMGGTLAHYARKGNDVYLVCATRGEAGTMDPEHLGNFKNVADKREAELRCAAQTLGLKEVFFLDYRDSGMPGSQDNKHPNAQINHPVEEVAGKVVKYIRELEPEVVLTFDPIGGYRHPDHIHIQQATTLAFEKADDASFYPEAGSPFKPLALYYHLFPREFLKWATRLMPLFGMDPRRWGRNKDIDLKSLVDVECPTHTRIDIRDVVETKREAGACHASQGGILMRRGLMGLATRALEKHEEYMRAYPPVNGKTKVFKDLFEGIT